MLKTSLLRLSESSTAKKIITRAPLSRSFAQRFVAGDTLDEALEAARVLFLAQGYARTSTDAVTRAAGGHLGGQALRRRRVHRRAAPAARGAALVQPLDQGARAPRTAIGAESR